MLGASPRLVKMVFDRVNNVMMFRRFIPLLVMASLALAACSRTPPPADRIQAVVVSEPPRPRHEESGPAPHTGWVWQAGYWNHVNERYVWVPGVWGVPPQGFHAWDAAHWVRDKQGGWVLVRGRWK